MDTKETLLVAFGASSSELSVSFVRSKWNVYHDVPFTLSFIAFLSINYFRPLTESLESLISAAAALPRLPGP